MVYVIHGLALWGAIDVLRRIVQCAKHEAPPPVSDDLGSAEAQWPRRGRERQA